MPFKTTSGTGYGYLAVEDDRIVEVLHEEDKGRKPSNLTVHVCAKQIAFPLRFRPSIPVDNDSARDIDEIWLVQGHLSEFM
jgi:hypothetical protein